MDDGTTFGGASMLDVPGACDFDTRTPVRAQTAAASSWQRSAYRPSAWTNGPAGLCAMAAACGLVAALALLDVDGHPVARPHDLVVLSVALTPPPPPPTRAAPHPAHAKAVAERIDAPAPIVEAPATIAAAPPLPAPPVATTVTTAPVVVAAPSAPPSPPAIADGGDMSSRMIEARPPVYPIDSRRRHEQGTVVLDVLVSTVGKVSNVTVAESSGSGLLDNAALVAVRGWRWAPTIREERPVMVRGTVRIPFVLRG